MSEQAVEQVVESTPEQQLQDESAALNAGYNKVRGEPPAEAATPEKQEVAAPGVDPATKDAPTTEEKPVVEADPWAGVNPALKEMLHGISNRMSDVDKLGQRFKSFEGRLGAVQNAMAAANAATKAAGAGAPTQQQITSAVSNSEKWTQLKADFPEFAEAMEEQLAAQAAKFSGHAQVDVAGIKKDLETSFSQSLAEIRKASTQEARQLAQVDIKHPDWEQTLASKEFLDWSYSDGPTRPEVARFQSLKESSPEEADAYFKDFARTYPDWWSKKGALLDSPLAKDANQLLDIYADHRKAVEKQVKNQARLAAVVAPKQANSGGPTVLPDEAGIVIGYNRVKKRA